MITNLAQKLDDVMGILTLHDEVVLQLALRLNAFENKENELKAHLILHGIRGSGKSKVSEATTKLSIEGSFGDESRITETSHYTSSNFNGKVFVKDEVRQYFFCVRFQKLKSCHIVVKRLLCRKRRGPARATRQGQDDFVKGSVESQDWST